MQGNLDHPISTQGKQKWELLHGNVPRISEAQYFLKILS